MNSLRSNAALPMDEGRDDARPEDAPLVRGEGRFTDNLATANGTDALWACFLRSPHAAAVIERIDTAEASTAPGVELVMTGAELLAAGVRPIPFLPLFKRPEPVGSPHEMSATVSPGKVIEQA